MSTYNMIDIFNVELVMHLWVLPSSHLTLISQKAFYLATDDPSASDRNSQLL